MRQVMFGQVVRTDLMWQAVGLNFIYLALGAGFFLLAFHSARRNGLLLRVGE
jgi:ABC-2 type transport system permease protein